MHGGLAVSPGNREERPEAAHSRRDQCLWSMAMVRTSPNVSVTFLEREGCHCDQGPTVGGDAERNTSFRVECGLEGDFLPALSCSRRCPSFNVISHHFTNVSPATRLPTTISVVKGQIFL